MEKSSQQHQQQQQQQPKQEVEVDDIASLECEDMSDYDFDSDDLNNPEDELNDFDGWDNATGGKANPSSDQCFVPSVARK